MTAIDTTRFTDRVALEDIREAAIVLSARLSDWIDAAPEGAPGRAEMLAADRAAADTKRLVRSAITAVDRR